MNERTTFLASNGANHTNEKNVLREDRYERCLHGEPPRVAEYSRGLSRASTRVSRIDSG